MTTIPRLNTAPPRSKNSEEPRIFLTTRWSLILSGVNSNGDSAKTQAALAELCRIYWRPVFSFVCRGGYSPQDAQDLTQDFFLMILETDWLQHADESRGRFRSFLLKSLQNSLNHAREKKQALKRGGDVQFISWDEWMVEAPSRLSIPPQTLETLPAERLFDLRWAATVVEHALRRLGEECEAKGRRRLFDALSSHLTAERTDVSYADLAASLGVAESAIKKQLHNLRERYRWLLRDEVAHTVANPADVDAEIRYLCAALAAGMEQP
ncbi:MAG TPA: sigma-70 family RNA polymerase sigma factor [Chthoniobacterales bacterium]|nr:sigma-70 family RNA polymerase sigma factor [Chthoniobacterales bacterium]